VDEASGRGLGADGGEACGGYGFAAEVERPGELGGIDGSGIEVLRVHGELGAVELGGALNLLRGAPRLRRDSPRAPG
jgi:hypothetical protein